MDLPASKLELRSKVCVAVESEIQTEALEYELSDEDYVDISERYVHILHTIFLGWN